jgi:hypothetical protein
LFTPIAVRKRSLQSTCYIFVEPILYRIGSFFSLSANDCLLWRTSLPVAIHIFFPLARACGRYAQPLYSQAQQALPCRLHSAQNFNHFRQ